ncbi:unnamed protein product [Polarella glacialis]|uniref:sn-1-specific diacylglycerol lipase n=1 Tax=Polarella glacialis TaxID=89957 RepID=A0A813EUP4_POLGL|nr:unnamed protein product [Polarella glacialis]
MPGHFVAVGGQRRAVVLGVRGTVDFCDAITDAVGNSVPFPEYPGVETHQAILAAARVLLQETRECFIETLTASPGFGVVVTGRSMGAGASILCALILKASPLPGNPRLRCFAFASPPMVTAPESPAVAVVGIIAVIHRHDIIPRVSLRNVYMLGKEAVRIDQLDLGVLDRIELICGGKSLTDSEHKTKVVTAVATAKEQAKAEKYQHFIPGKVFWIDSDVSPARVLLASHCNEFQEVLLRADTVSLEDHHMANYKKVLESLFDTRTVTFPVEAAKEAAKEGQRMPNYKKAWGPGLTQGQSPSLCWLQRGRPAAAPNDAPASHTSSTVLTLLLLWLFLFLFLLFLLCCFCDCCRPVNAFCAEGVAVGPPSP